MGKRVTAAELIEKARKHKKDKEKKRGLLPPDKPKAIPAPVAPVKLQHYTQLMHTYARLDRNMLMHSLVNLDRNVHIIARLGKKKFYIRALHEQRDDEGKPIQFIFELEE